MSLLSARNGASKPHGLWLIFGTLAMVVGLLLLVPSVCHSAKLVRISLGKTTAMQAGEYGQPTTSFYTNVAIGTPPKLFKMLVDVNAREIWVPHYSHAGFIATRLNYRNGYAKKDSSTSVKEETKFTIEYRQCELSGKAYTDHFEFKNVTESMVPVTLKQRFLAISSASNDNIGRLQVDGVLALNPWPISETGSDLITVGLSRGSLTSELKFGLYLEPGPAPSCGDSSSNNINSNQSGGGELTFGGYNQNKFTGLLKYHAGIGQFAWEVRLQSVSLGANIVSCSAGSSCTATLATAHNDIYGPPEDVNQIMRLLGFSDKQIQDNNTAKRVFEIDCLRVADLPQLSFLIDGLQYTIKPTSYIKRKVDGLIFKSCTCYVAILPNLNSPSNNQWILGTNFLSNFYTVFDVNLRQVAFAPLVK